MLYFRSKIERNLNKQAGVSRIVNARTKQTTMKNLLTFLITVLLTLSVSAQTGDASNLNGEIVESMDSVIVFTFTDIDNVKHEATGVGAHWRNSDFICIYRDFTFESEDVYWLKGSVRYRKELKK